MSGNTTDLVTRAQRGDRHAFAHLVEAFYPRGLRFAQHMLGVTEDAEEALQDTFVRVYDNLSRFRPGTPFEPWFFRILANRCRTYGARRQRRHALVEYSDAPPDGVYHDNFDVDDWQGDVARALASLPADQREAFLLRHVEDMSYDDMASIIGVRPATLRMRVSRAAEALRARLTKEAVIHD